MFEFHMIKVVSIVTLFKLNQAIDLNYLSNKIDGAILPKKPGIWIKLRLEPEHCHVIFYKSGKILVTGIKTFKGIDKIAQIILEKLKDADVSVEIADIEIINVVCMSSINLKSSLEKIISYLDSKNASYEPEQFPGLIYKNWGVTFMLFSSGKVIITGLKDFQIANELLEKFEKKIKG